MRLLISEEEFVNFFCKTQGQPRAEIDTTEYKSASEWSKASLEKSICMTS